MPKIIKRQLPSQRPYEAHGAARDLWSCRDEEILIEGPAGTGKSRAVLEKLNFCALKYPGMRALVVRQTRESCTESVLVTFEEKVIPANSEVLAGPQRRLRAAYDYPNGSSIVIGGMDKPTKIMSTEYDVIYVAEATEVGQEAFENLTTRLRNGVMPYQQIIADCNPGQPNHWLNQRAKKHMTRLLSRHKDNPVLFDRKTGEWTPQGKKYREKLKRLTGARRARLFKGLWAAAEGMVYDQWDSTVHIIPRIKIPKNWRRIRVIDFGFVNPLVCQWWAISPEDNTMYLYREFYQTKMLVAEAAEIIKGYSELENIEATICDHDSENRASLESAGIPTIKAYKDVERGIQAVQDRLGVPSPEKKSDYRKPRLYLFQDALVERDENLVEAELPVWTGEEVDNYVWPKGQDGKPLKEEPVKKDDHGMDAMRYGVAYVDGLEGMILQTELEETAVVENDDER